MKVILENGKYEWNFDEQTGKLTCKRYGQDWRDETGDSAILALIQYIEKLENKG